MKNSPVCSQVGDNVHGRVKGTVRVFASDIDVTYNSHMSDRSFLHSHACNNVNDF